MEDDILSAKNFSFYTSVSAVFSSKIEGEDIQLDSYIKHKKFNAHFSPDYTRKTDDLYEAYLFAQQNKLTYENLLNVHRLITKNILQQPQQGQLRNGNMYVLTNDGKIEYVAAIPSILKTETKKFESDLHLLLQKDLTFEEVFFYASLLHLVFVKIHPFEDGNGRTARLMEKWFLAEKIGAKSWFIQSEKYYYQNHNYYYKAIRKLGLEYAELDYLQAEEFLHMLPNSLLFYKK